MAELMSLADVSAISSSMDPIYTGSAAPLALTAARIHAVLRRTKSMGYHNDLQHIRKLVTADEEEDEEDEGGYLRGKANSPVRANSRRRRSAAPVHRLRIGGQSRSEIVREIVRETNSLPSRHGSIELGSHYYRNVSSRSVSRPHTPSTATSSQRSPSRGRTRRRVIPHSSDTRWGKKHQHAKRSNTSRQRQSIHSESISSSEQAEDPSSSDADDVHDNVSSYVKKGAFRLQYPRGLAEFRFPKSKSQQEPTWHAGDGFSGDEARPDFIFLMTGKHKRKRSRSVSALGQLSVEAENTVKDNAAGSASSQPHLRLSRGSQANIRRREVRDLWPTRENFTDDSIAQKQRITVLGDHSIIKSTSPLTPTPVYMLTPEMRQALPRKRQTSDFENFGRRKRRSQSGYGEYPTLSSTKVPRQYEESYVSSDDGEVGDSPYESVGEESEEQSMGDDESEHIPATVYDSDDGFEMPSEDDSDVRDDQDQYEDEDEDMQDTVPDRKKDKEPLRSSDLGERRMNRAGLLVKATQVQSFLNPSLDEKQVMTEKYLSDGQGWVRRVSAPSVSES
ncbi:hypothetical protein HD806DRAFT_541201 [Xylariaceae sp. AK1471]|nr:hypothetical protein HD806DRAFT_541201 [Xylariaceae sp. AK1471]